MIGKRLLTGGLVFAVLLTFVGVASAQDMVFTTTDTGNVAAPPPPPSGPPSEALANALRLYQQEHYGQAAVQFQRIVQGETGDQPANVQKGQFFLGKCFYHLGFFQAALGVFEEIDAVLIVMNGAINEPRFAVDLDLDPGEAVLVYIAISKGAG